MRSLVALALLLGLLAVPAARAQNVAADPTFGVVRLNGGFLPDPHQVALVAGGSLEVNRGRCTYGHVADAPDVDFYYDGNGARTLYIYASSSEDVTLLINLPDGTWVCDDDGLGGTDPLVVVRNAPDGLYNIWVGTYRGGTARATLYISEIDPR